MSDLKNIANQSFVFLLGTIFTLIVGFFFKIYLANQLGAEGLGIYSLGISIITILSIFVSLGLGNGLVKYVSKYVAEKNYIQLQTYLHYTFKFSFISTIIFGFILFYFANFIANNFLNTPGIEPYLCFFSVMLIIYTFLTLFDQTIRGLKEVKKSTIFGNFIRQPLKIISAIVFIKIGLDLEGYLYAEILAAVITIYFFYRITKKHLPSALSSIRSKPLSKITNEERSFGINFMIIGVVGVFNVEADKILLAKYFTIDELGIYSIILTFTAFVPIVLKSVISIFGPIISEKFAVSRFDEVKGLIEQTSYYIFLITFSIIIIIAFSGKLLLRLFGSEFVIGYVPMIIILIGCFFDVISGAVGTVLIMSGNEKKVRNIKVIGFFVSVSLFFVLIPLLGILGAAIIKMTVLILTNTYLTWLMYKKNNIFIFNKRYLKLIIYSLLSLLSLIYLREIFGWDSPSLIISSLLVYLFLFYAYWYFFLAKKNEQKIIIDFIQSKFNKNG